MKKLLLMASVAALSGAAVPAFAQVANSVTGTVTVQGEVTPACSATGFSGQIQLGEIDNQATGALDPTVPNNTGLTKDFNVVCNSAKPTVVVTATELTTPGSPQAGQTNVVDYTATATEDLAAGGSTPVAYATAPVKTSTTVQLGGALANPASHGPNVHVNFSLPHTTPANAILIAGTYNSEIDVTVEPTS